MGENRVVRRVTIGLLPGSANICQCFICYLSCEGKLGCSEGNNGVYICVFEKEINIKKTFFISFVLFCMDIDICPLLEGDRIIPLYTSSNLNQ